MPEVSDDDEVEACRLAGRDHIRQGLADLAAEVAGGEVAHEDARARLDDRVHPDAVAQQRAAALAPACGVDDGDGAALVVLVQSEAADQLVGERELCRRRRCR